MLTPLLKDQLPLLRQQQLLRPLTVMQQLSQLPGQAVSRLLRRPQLLKQLHSCRAIRTVRRLHLLKQLHSCRVSRTMSTPRLPCQLPGQLPSQLPGQRPSQLHGHRSSTTLSTPQLPCQLLSCRNSRTLTVLQLQVLQAPHAGLTSDCRPATLPAARYILLPLLQATTQAPVTVQQCMWKYWAVACLNGEGANILHSNMCYSLDAFVLVVCLYVCSWSIR